jgi:hypothetical protein
VGELWAPGDDSAFSKALQKRYITSGIRPTTRHGTAVRAAANPPPGGARPKWTCRLLDASKLRLVGPRGLFAFVLKLLQARLDARVAIEIIA